MSLYKKQKEYTKTNADNDMAIIQWLLTNGAITNEDARFMKNYVQALI